MAFETSLGMNVGKWIILAAGGLMVGCANKPPAPAKADRGEPVIYEARYQDPVSSALAFDPPVTAGERLPDLSRDLRDPAAFIGFDGPSTTFYWIHTDDQQESDWGGGGRFGPSDRYERRAVMDKTGVTYR